MGAKNFDSVLTESHQAGGEVDQAGDRGQDAASLKDDLKQLLTESLSREERFLVMLHYYEKMSIAEISQTLDLSESRVTQMHRSILSRLQAQTRLRGRGSAGSND